MTRGSPSAVVSLERDMCTTFSLHLSIGTSPPKVPGSCTEDGHDRATHGCLHFHPYLDFQVNYWNQANDTEGLGQLNRGRGLSYMYASKKGYANALNLFLHDSGSDLMVKFCPSLPITVKYIIYVIILDVSTSSS